MATTARKMCYPSALERRWLCPGSAAREALHPYNNESSPAAKEGVMLHAMVVELIKDPEYSLEGLDEEQIESIRWVANQARALITPESIVAYEEKLDMRSVGIENNYKPDMIIMPDENQRIVIDFKFGRGYVTPPKWNKQFRAYAYGVKEHFGGEIFWVISLQPRAMFEENRFQDAEFTDAQVETFGDEIRTIVAGVEDPSAPLIPGKRQCQYCRENEVCEARKESLRAVPQHLNWESYLDSLPPEERFAKVKNLDLAAAYIKRLQEASEEYVLKGKTIPGYAIGESRKNQVWIDPMKAEMRLRALALQRGKNPEDLINPPKLKGVTDICRIIGGGKDTKAEVDALRMRPQGEPCMVEDPLSAPKAEITGKNFFSNFNEASLAIEQGTVNS